ncbi:MAG TPA: DUF4915 domain-containing protein [Acidimicrobiales bacterium]|nr:DUF4915 domain-containing protein [Acidimicrobiales bacterium]
MAEQVATTHWRDQLGDAHVLVSGFGKWGGGMYDLTTGAPEALDDLPTSGLSLGGERLWRVLRAPGEQSSVCELMSYDARGVRTYHRLDAIRDPHDVLWFDGAPHISSSWDDAVWRVDPASGEPTMVWQGSTVPDGWHVNSLLAVDDALHVCAFGRFDRHKGWKHDEQDAAGFVHDLRTGRDVLTCLSHPHTPRKRGARWYVCESTKGSLTELAADGTVRRRARVNRFTRGLAFVGSFALVGGNARRGQDDDRAEIAVVDMRSFAVLERIPMPCLEVYDIILVGAGVVRGVTTGFGTNAARAVEQHRSSDRTDVRQSTPADVAVHLVTPRTAARLAAMGEPLDPDEASRCGVRGTLPPVAAAGEITTWSVEVLNRSSNPLGSVPPRPVKVGVRWFRLPDGDDAPAPEGEPVANPLGPVTQVLPPHMRTEIEVPVEVPHDPGRYEVRIALRQPGLGWFGIRIQGEVTVKALS